MSDKLFFITIVVDSLNYKPFWSVFWLITKDKFAVPIQINGIDAPKAYQPDYITGSLTLDPNILRLGCGYCYWESVLGISPVNSNYGYFVGGGTSDYLVVTNDSWNTSQTSYITPLTNSPKLSFRGDPKLAFDKDSKLIVSSLLKNLSSSEPITGGLYLDFNNYILNPNFNQTILLPVISDLQKGTWIIYDYPKISVDANPDSQFFGNIYVFANSVRLENGDSGQGIFVVNSTGNISKRIMTEGDYGVAVTSTVTGQNGEVYIVYYGNGNSIQIARSFDGARHFIENTILDPSDLYCAGRVSSQSNVSWFIYGGPEIAIDNNGVLYAVWAKPEECRQDPNFEYETYGYDYNVYFSYSNDGGVTWANPMKVNNDNSGGDQGFPSIKIDNSGEVYVSFLDHRNNQDIPQYDVYLAKFNKITHSFAYNIKVNDLSVPNYRGQREPGDYLDMLGFSDNQIFVSHPCVNLNFLPNPFGDISNDACVAKIDKNFSLCTDTDGGLNYNAKGTVTLTNFSGTYYYQDSCVPKNYNLLERYCNGNNVASLVYTCPSGQTCSNGACKPVPSPSPSCYYDKLKGVYVCK